MAENEVEIEQGPAVAGPFDAQQPVDKPTVQVGKRFPAPNANKVFNVSDEEIALTARQNAEAEDEAKTAKSK